ncbi:MAG: hypothetical protein ACTS3R_16565 [Inquilinaceae bacterium]
MLGGCDGTDWTRAGERWARDTCEAAGNCDLVCPDGGPPAPSGHCPREADRVGGAL